MTDTASDTSSDFLDALVPPPAPAWRCVVAWALFIAAVVGVGWVWSTGVANPKVSSQVATWGGDGPVHIGFRIDSDSSVDLELTDGFGVPDGLTLLGYSTAPLDADVRLDSIRDDVFPYRLAPGETVGLTAFYEVDDCAVLPGGDTTVAVTAAIADGPFSPFEYRRRIIDDLFSDDDGSPASWAKSIAAFVCGTDGE